FLGAWEGRRPGTWFLAMECLEGTEGTDPGEAARWPRARLEAVIGGAAGIHSAWYGREAPAGCSFAPEIPWDEANRMSPVWGALARFAAPRFAEWGDGSRPALHRRLIETLPDWWRELDAQPRTLIHNDCNPRNLAFRRVAGADPVVCAFDWELARFGP